MVQQGQESTVAPVRSDDPKKPADKPEADDPAKAPTSNGVVKPEQQDLVRICCSQLG